MKTFAKVAFALLAITVACQAGLALAEEYYFTSGGEQGTATASAEKATGQECASCCPNACGNEGCGGTCNSCTNQLGCEEDCKRFSVVGFAGFDSFKGISDVDGPSNFGAVSGLNTGLMFPGLEDYGFGWQTGFSYGLYDFDGGVRANGARSQQQTFITTGFYRKAQSDQRVSFGLVYDWMLNDQWGANAINPTLGQWRGQFEYALNGCNSVGFWGCVRDRFANSTNAAGVPITNRPISQANLFWHHKFNAGADSNLWVGIPERERLNGDKTLLDWTFGASVQVPLSERMALYANAAYFHPSASASPIAAIESGYDISMGVVWYFGGKAHTNALNGTCSTPYMPVANNSNFLVDQDPL